MQLPENFIKRMAELLGDELDLYLRSLDEPFVNGLRFNTLKVDGEERQRLLDALFKTPVPAVPWTEAGCYWGEERMPAAKNPWYSAGLYYIQEPSAQSPAEFLKVQPGDRVLDLCAAPGGKSTRLGEKLKGQGILVCNDISASRARALLVNLERFGIKNVFVTAEAPDRLSKAYPEYFNKILVDAPCSGEGMFHKDPAMIRDWAERGPEWYAPVQSAILDEAYNLLAQGGSLLYSTCTFSKEEDEEQIERFLLSHSDMELVTLTGHTLYNNGFIDINGMLKLLPHRVNGAGHFLALLKRKGSKPDLGPLYSIPKMNTKQRKALEDYFKFEALMNNPPERERLVLLDNVLYALPDEGIPGGLRFIRTGLKLGEMKNGRFEPAQALAMTLDGRHFKNCIRFSSKDIRVIRYLKGETVLLDSKDLSSIQGDTGWCLVLCDGHPLGFARRTDTILKNKYKTGWRWQ